MRNVLAVLVAAIVVARASASAAADPPPLVRQLSMDLAYEPGPGTENCFSPHDMQLRLIGAFRYDPFDREPTPELHVGIKVEQQEERFHAELRLTFPDGSRLWAGEARGVNCVEMLSNVALVAATQVLIYVLKIPKPIPKPVPPADAPAPSDVPPSLPAPVPSPPRSPPSPRLAAASKAPLNVARAAPPPGAPPASWSLRIGAAGELSFGFVPGAGAGASAGAGLQWGKHVSFNLDVRGLIALSPNDVHSHKIHPYFLGGSLDVCLEQQLAASLIFLCPILHAGGGLIPLGQTSRTIYKELRPLAFAALGGRFGADWQITQGYSLRTNMDLAYAALHHDAGYNGESDNAGIPLVGLVTLGIMSAPKPLGGRSSR